MSNDKSERLLHELALLYLAMAQSGDDDLSYAEREAVTDNLHSRYAHLRRADVQNIVLEVLAVHQERADLLEASRQAAHALRNRLSEPQKKAVLQDLVRVAQADGVVLAHERDLLANLARQWEVDIPSQALAPSFDSEDTEEATWGPLTHLAFIYLVLAHGTDRELSQDERDVILLKLREWKPPLSDRAVQTILEQALERYARGSNQERLAASVEAVKEALPAAQRKAALNDLIQIANADGVFLDSEEDLLNDLMAAWDLDAFGGFGGISEE
ncbi:MAG: TerB family tellurite resistance protein [Rhodothermales bacterium]